MSFVHRKEVQSAAPYKSSVNLVPYGPWDPTRQPRIRSVSADGWARAFAMLLSEVMLSHFGGRIRVRAVCGFSISDHSYLQGFGVHNAYVPAASYRDHDVPSTPPTPEKTPVQHIRALFSKVRGRVESVEACRLSIFCCSLLIFHEGWEYHPHFVQSHSVVL